MEAMFKRILTLGTGALLGIAFVLVGTRVATAWSLWPNRELSRAAGYVKDVMRLVNDNYVDEKAASYEKLSRTALHGMIETLDPHSQFLEKKDNEEFEEDLTGEFGGVGIQVETRQNRIVVIAPLAGTPSETRYDWAVTARRSPSARLYSAVPRSSVCPSIVTVQLAYLRSNSAVSSSVARASGVSSLES